MGNNLKQMVSLGLNPVSGQEKLPGLKKNMVNGFRWLEAGRFFHGKHAPSGQFVHRFVHQPGNGHADGSIGFTQR